MFTLQEAINEKWVDHPKFLEGYRDGWNGAGWKEYDNIEGQAYDRGLQVGLQEYRKAVRRNEEAKQEPKHWGDEPGIETRVGCN